MHHIQHPAYTAMVRASKGVLKRFRSDLTDHDRRTLALIPHDEPFLWGLRVDGTFLALVGRPHKKPVAQYPEWVQSAFGDEVTWYRWDGRELTRLADMKAAADWAFEQETLAFRKSA